MYQKEIIYMGLYKDGSRIGNAGFLKVENREEESRFQLKLQNIPYNIKGRFPVRLYQGNDWKEINGISVQEGGGSWEENLKAAASGVQVQIMLPGGYLLEGKGKGAPKHTIRAGVNTEERLQQPSPAVQTEPGMQTNRPENSRDRELQESRWSENPQKNAERENTRESSWGENPQKNAERENVPESRWSENPQKNAERENAQLSDISVEQDSNITRAENAGPDKAQNTIDDDLFRNAAQMQNGSTNSAGDMPEKARRSSGMISEQRNEAKFYNLRGGSPGRLPQIIPIENTRNSEPARRERQAAIVTEELQRQEAYSLKEDKWEQILESYEKIHPYGDERVYVKLEPKDFIILQAKYQHLVNNSFLLHGFYNYRYVILGKEQDYYLGVPGVFYEREKMVALMFGFEAFECPGGTAKAGEFGYYLRKVEL
ncbi:MAG: hypothetical protein HFI60_13660 [Lachnospiraceae bacterium]|nr:hypothetical protein [Lachnospiraceae bacterium]